MADLPCENGGGSLNNPNGSPAQIGTNNPNFKPYVPPVLPIGGWEITSLNPDLCARNEQANQEAYVAETLNISGAPINIYPLKGIHQQGNGSILTAGKIITSPSYPGYPNTGINGATPWRSLTIGSTVASPNTFVGVDFGIKKMRTQNISEYEPEKPKWMNIGALEITQSNDPNFFARQVKVELATGDCESALVSAITTGNGTLAVDSMGVDVTPGTVLATALTPTTFNCYVTLPDNSIQGLGVATINVPFFSTLVNFTITSGTIPFVTGDSFQFNIVYKWLRVGIFNLIQSPLSQVLNLKVLYKVKAVRVTPTLFTGTGNWEVLKLDVLDSPPTDIDNIQDLFFNENRDRDYALVPLLIKAQYSPADSVTDLSRFGLSILDQYSFSVSFATMVSLLGRPIVVGDIVEVIPEMQWDQNLKPIRKFLEVTDTGWASAGFGTSYNPTVYRFNAQIALPSQETRDIFGTLDTEKYMVPDAVIADDLGSNLNIWALTATEEINKNAVDAVPEFGTDDIRSVAGTVVKAPPAQANPKGQPPQGSAMPAPVAGVYVEAGLPPNGEPYGEGYALPEITTAHDGEYFRLYYPQETKIPPRLHRFSALKNRWIYLETDRRQVNNSAKPSLQNILQSSTQQPLGKK